MPATFSEFILSVCGTDTMIDYWDAMTTCRLKIESDTLFLEELRYLPTGKDMKPQETVWTIEKICFDKEKMIREFMVNRQIRKYDRNEVQMVLKEYETAAPGLDDDKMALANKLFLATISGDGNARQYFREFRTRFGTLDGAFSEEYSDLAAMLDLWDKKANDAR